MADLRKGDVAGGLFLTTSPAATHITSTTDGDDAGSDQHLLDFSDTGLNGRNIVTDNNNGFQAQMEHSGPFNTLNNAGNGPASSSGYVSSTDAQHDLLLDRPQDKPNLQSPNISSGSFSPPSYQTRQNPFDFPALDLSQSGRPKFTSHEPNSGIGNSTNSEIDRFDQYDPINFGDPTFVNSYSSPPSTLSSSGQVPVSFVHSVSSATTQDSKLDRKARRFLENVSTPPRTSTLQSLSDSSIASTSVHVSGNPRFPVSGPSPDPWGPVNRAGTDSLLLTPINLSQAIQQELLKGQPIKSAQTLTSSISPTDSRIDSWVAHPAQNHNYHNPDLFIRDYTSSPLENNPYYSHVRPRALPGNMTDNGAQYARPMNTNSKRNPPRSGNGETQGYTRGLRPNSDLSVNLNTSLADNTKTIGDWRHGSHRRDVASISNNRLVDVSNLSNRPLGEFHSLVNEGAENGLYVHAGMSWNDSGSEDRFLEETPLLEVGCEDERRRGFIRGPLSVWPGASHESAPLVSHFRERPGVTSRTTDQAVEYRRTSNGEFNPVPYFSENGGIGRHESGEFRISTSLRHCHKPNMSSLTDKLARRQLVSVTVLCLLFMVGEAVGGVLANSLALFTDVLHLGSDLISFFISLLAMWLANKPATRRMSFGYHRAEVIGALLSVFIIWLVSGVLCYIAVDRIIHEHYKSVRADEMLITASLGVIFNIIMGLVLHSEMCCGHAHTHSKFGHGHSHGSGEQGHTHGSGGHGHSHNHVQDNDLLDVPETARKEDNSSHRQGGFHYQHLHHAEDGGQTHQEMRDVNSMAMAHPDEGLNSEEDHPRADNFPQKQKNINVRAAFIHVVGDIIQSLGVLVAALIIKFTTDEKYRLADPICTFLFSLLVLVTTITVLRDTLLVIMEGVPRDLSIDAIRKELSAIHGVVTVHSMHIWSLTLDRNALSVHLVIENTVLHDQVLSSAIKLLQDKYHFFHSTIQVELLDEVAMKNCQECTEWT